MHELSYVEEVFKLVKNYLKDENNFKNLKVYLEISLLSGIEEDSFNFYWDCISKNTKFNNAKLYFKKKQTKAICKYCKQKLNLEKGSEGLIKCPKCNKLSIIVSEVNEVNLIKIVYGKNN